MKKGVERKRKVLWKNYREKDQRLGVIIYKICEWIHKTTDRGTRKTGEMVNKISHKKVIKPGNNELEDVV